MTITIGIVAGEASGDILGAALVKDLQQRLPGCQFVGIAGPEMQALGVKSLFPMETLSVMGIKAVLMRLPAILKIRRGIIHYFSANPPDLFIGIDAPDFNLTVEERLHQQGIKTLHYVSPSIWAWKAGRIHKIKRATDGVLCILPFEEAIYAKHQHPAYFVGHPLAQQIPMMSDTQAARQALELPAVGPCLALLPGSRSSEVQLLLKPFLQAAALCKARIPGLTIVLPLAHPRLKPLLAKEQALLTELQVKVVAGQSRTVMTAADAVLLASGTATLEAMLLKKPMVVAYKFGPLSFVIARLFVKIRLFALPNIIAGKALVPEFFQQRVTSTALAEALLARLQDPAVQAETLAQFEAMHRLLQKPAGPSAAEVVIKVLDL